MVETLLSEVVLLESFHNFVLLGNNFTITAELSLEHLFHLKSGFRAV